MKNKVCLSDVVVIAKSTQYHILGELERRGINISESLRHATMWHIVRGMNSLLKSQNITILVNTFLDSISYRALE